MLMKYCIFKIIWNYNIIILNQNFNLTVNHIDHINQPFSAIINSNLGIPFIQEPSIISVALNQADAINGLPETPSTYLAVIRNPYSLSQCRTIINSILSLPHSTLNYLLSTTLWKLRIV